jgi:predicted secreted Zn-dependent protease
MRILPWPDGIEDDQNATEMIRVWIAKNELQVSMLLGMWADAESYDIDEKHAWGELLADLIRHIANGMRQSHGRNKDEAELAIANSLLNHLGYGEDTVEGNYKE